MKAILTVIGKDKPGIIARVATVLAENEINIEDISQTVLQGNFTMIMFVNLAQSKLPLAHLVALFATVGNEIGVEIYLQHEDLFNAMHTI